MKPATIALIASGAVILGACLWASFYVTVSAPHAYTSSDGAELDYIIERNVWGMPLRYRVHCLYRDQSMKPHGPGVGPIPDEREEWGAVNRLCGREGRWILRARNGTQWTESEAWYRNDKQVTREEWERR